MLLNSDVVLGLIKTYRVCFVGGRYGGGKTALCVRLAYDLLESGFVKRCVSNIPIVFGDDWEQLNIDDVYHTDTVIILDEGGLFLEDKSDVKEYLAFLRKMNITLLIPSVEPPSTRVRGLTIQRTFNLSPIGVPLWVYSAFLKSGSIREDARFGWWRPSEIFGLYDTKAAPVDDDGISDWIIALKERIKGKSRSRQRAYSERLESSEMKHGALMEAADIIYEASENNLRASGYGKRKRK